MPNVEFIARNGIVSRGNLVVSGSVISTSPASFSGSLSVTGSLGILNTNTSSSVLLDITGSTNNLLTFRSNPLLDAGQNGLRVNVSSAGYDANSSRVAYNFQVGGTSYFTIANYGLATFAQSIETKTMVLQYNPSNTTTLRVYAQGASGNAIETGGSEGTVHLGSNTVNTKVNEILRITGKGTTSSTTALLVQNANASSSFSIKDNGDSTFTYPGIGGYSLKISGSLSGNGASAIYETLGASGGYYGIHEFRIGTNTANAVRAMSIVYGGRVVIGNNSDTVLQHPRANLFVDTNVVNAFTSQSFNTGITINPSGSLNTSFTASGIQFNFAANNPNDTSGGVFVGSQWNPATNGYDSDLVIYNSQGNAGSYVETARFVGKSRSLSLGAGRNPSASLHISGSSNSALFEIDSPAVNNIIFVSGSGNVGIGTGTPTYALEVSGSTGNRGVIRSRRLIAYGGTAADPAMATESTIAGLFEAGYAQLGFSSYGGEAGRIEGASRLWNIGMTGGTAKFNIKGTGTTSSTTAFQVQNANASASFSVRDDGLINIPGGGKLNFNNGSTECYITTATGGTGLGSRSLTLPGTGGPAHWLFYNDSAYGIRLQDSTGDWLTISPGSTSTTSIFTINKSAASGFGGGTFVYYQTNNNNRIYTFGNPSSERGDETGVHTKIVAGAGGTVSTQYGRGGNVYLEGGAPAFTSSLPGDILISTGVTGSKVGIGTSTPSASLHISGASNRVLFEIDSPAVNNIIYVSGSGNVGIGTSTPTSTLHVSGSTYIYKSGSTVLDIQGSQGQLFSVIDALSGSLMSVNDISGLPIVEVFSDDRVVMGTYGAPGLTVSGSTAAVATGSSAPTGTAPEGTFRFAVAGGLYYIYAYIGGAWRSGSLA